LSDSREYHIVFLASWYPGPAHPLLGIFIRRHAEAAAMKHKVTVLHAVSDLSMKEGEFRIVKHEEGNLREVILHYGKKVRKNKFLNAIAQFRLLKLATPGPWTFILEASREVPRRVSHPSRKTIGVRVPNHPVTLALLELAEGPLLSTTLIPEGEEYPLNDPVEIRERYEHRLAAVIDAGACALEPTTVIDLTGTTPQIVRRGLGDPETLGLSHD
jgi:tRNA threonylcarbamoyl adenosine modification protein (Sua5/YciO/YrdC/YwlC family)